MQQGGVIQGSMRDAPLPDIIQLVSQAGRTGCFHVQQDTSRAWIYLKDGRIVHAATQAGEGIEAFMEVAVWLDGNYWFEEGETSTPTTISGSGDSILAELGRRMEEWRILFQKVPSVDLYPVATFPPEETLQRIHPREAKVLALASGYYSVAELAEVTVRPVLEVAKDIYGLVMAGRVTLEGSRSGDPPQMGLPAPQEARLVPASALFGTVEVHDPAAPSEARNHAGPGVTYPPRPHMSGFPEKEEPIPETVGGGFAGGAPLEANRPPMQPTEDPQRLVKLMNFTQRIAQAAKGVLPEAQHEMVNRFQARSTQQVLAGEGVAAVKGLALAISRGAVEAGCDADLVRTLNANLKSLFNSRLGRP